MDIPNTYLDRFKVQKQEEFQALCTELEPYYGKAVWSLVYKPGFTEHKLREAHKIAQQRGIVKLNYLIGIIRKLN